jgi:hypothetical protein
MKKAKGEIVTAPEAVGQAAPKPSGWAFKVKSATLHQAVVLARLISTDKTLNANKVPGLEMTWIPQGLLCRVKGRAAIIPHANVAIAEVEE